MTPEAIEELIVLHRFRRATMKQCFRINNGTAALIRSSLGFKPVLVKDDFDTDKEYAAATKANNELKKLALKMLKSGESGIPQLDAYIMNAEAARRPFDVYRKGLEKRQAEIVRTMPIWEWAKPISGLAEGSIAAIIGECGDLNNYPSFCKVWKRMGLAPYKGKSMATWKKTGGLSSAEWIEIGDRHTGRTVMFNIGESLLKKKSYLREVYDEYKAKKEGEDYAHRKAMRYMQKRCLRDMWRAWRGHWSADTQSMNAPHAAALK